MSDSKNQVLEYFERRACIVSSEFVDYGHLFIPRSCLNRSNGINECWG